ncbi:hypothetical protein [Marinobacter confluentis]|uniref:hypothetical protein n=1 Tax=Marinobacter confluentis TaxID=1697557 RepID=UPI00143DFAD7|nr:hypothetical protein [Marinobacter confluentis]
MPVWRSQQENGPGRALDGKRREKRGSFGLPGERQAAKAFPSERVVSPASG